MILAFPSYEFLKSFKQEKDITLFSVYGNVYGRVRLNEDGEPGFWFDLMLNGQDISIVIKRGMNLCISMLNIVIVQF